MRRPGPAVLPDTLPQDLHFHTVFSRGDGAVVPEQTVELVARIAHARVIGISDHLEYVGAEWVAAAEALPVDYYVYHCRDRAEDYRGAARYIARELGVEETLLF